MIDPTTVALVIDPPDNADSVLLWGLGPKWKAVLEQKRTGGVRLSRAISSALLVTAQSCLETGKVGSALGACRVMCFFSPAAVQQLRGVGLFRASRLGFRAENISTIIQDLLVNADFLRLEENDRGYLGSINALLAIAPEARVIRQKIVKMLRQRRETVVKSLLIVVDREFRPYAGHTPVQHEKALTNPDSFNFFGLEERASALSLLVHIFEESVGLIDRHTAAIDEQGIRNGEFNQLLHQAAILNEVTTAEVLLDAYPYSARREGNTVVVAADDPRLEQSVRIGYVQSSLQFIVRKYESHRAELPGVESLKSFVAKMYARLGGELIRRIKAPIERRVVLLPLVDPLKDLLGLNALLKEELLELNELRAEIFGDFHWMVDAKVDDQLTLMDLIKAKRLLGLIAGLYFTASDEDPSWVLGESLDQRSRIPVFTDAQIHQFLAMALGDDKARALIDIWTYDPKQGGFFDIQYQPLVRIGNYIAVPLGLFNASNTIRNFLCHQHKRLLPADGSDPMQRSLAAALEAQGFLVKIDQELKHNGKVIEIDLLAIRGNLVLAWECKNAFHPCDPHEMRTSYKHILKAGRQLDGALTWLRDSAARGQAFKSWGWPAVVDPEFSTCIVTANRIFYGYAVNGHPIRHAYEMSNVLSRGEINLQGEKRRIWASETFAVEDLLAFVRGDTTTADFYACTEPYTYAFTLGKRRLAFDSFTVDLDKLMERSKARYPLSRAVETISAPPGTPGDTAP